MIGIRLYCASFLFSFGAEASLFLTSEQKSQVVSQGAFSQEKLEESKKKLNLKLTGIFHRPDLKHWMVWINGQKIDSEFPQSIQGWTVCHVGFDYVTLRSFRGEEIVLYLEEHKPPVSAEKEPPQKRGETSGFAAFEPSERVKATSSDQRLKANSKKLTPYAQRDLKKRARERAEIDKYIKEKMRQEKQSKMRGIPSSTRSTLVKLGKKSPNDTDDPFIPGEEEEEMEAEAEAEAEEREESEQPQED